MCIIFGRSICSYVFCICSFFFAFAFFVFAFFFGIWSLCVREKCPNFCWFLFTASVWLLDIISCNFGWLLLVPTNKPLVITCSYSVWAFAAIFLHLQFFWTMCSIFGKSICSYVFCSFFLHLHFFAFAFFFGVWSMCVRVKCPNFFWCLFTASVWFLDFISRNFGWLLLVPTNKPLVMTCSYLVWAFAAIFAVAAFYTESFAAIFCICSFFDHVQHFWKEHLQLFFLHLQFFLYLHFFVFAFFFGSAGKMSQFFWFLFTASVWLLDIISCNFGVLLLVPQNKPLFYFEWSPPWHVGWRLSGGGCHLAPEVKQSGSEFKTVWDANLLKNYALFQHQDLRLVWDSSINSSWQSSIFTSRL